MFKLSRDHNDWNSRTLQGTLLFSLKVVEEEKEVGINWLLHQLSNTRMFIYIGQSRLWKFSWTHIQDADSYSDADSTKHDFDPSKKTLNDY